MGDLEQELLAYKEKIEELRAYNNRLKNILLSNKLGEKKFRLAVKTSHRIEFVSILDIIYCKADNGNSEIYLGGDKMIRITKPLTSLERNLEDFSFFKVSKSYIINMNFVIAFHRDINQIELPNDVFLDLARRKRSEFLKMM